MTDIRVGGRTEAEKVITAKVTGYLTDGGDRWSYPAYDSYPGSPGTEIGPADLLAPVLLNVRMKNVGTYYALESKLEELNNRLAAFPDKSLRDATGDDLKPLVHLIEILDSPSIPGSQLTMLAKIVHRKRPALFPLYDSHVWKCYVGGEGFPLPVNNKRLWGEFAAGWLPAVQKDLRDQWDFWENLASLAKETPVTPLRVLDIAAWFMGGPGTPDATIDSIADESA